MTTNFALDSKLVEQARLIGGHKTKKAAVTAALQEYVRIRMQLKILDLAGTIDYHPNYDYKANRRR
ncbi:type II toxin-antitoxin system VapB family antitoxin [Planctomicrobium piriforme]|uniref:Antitoxin of type II TA system, VapB n=1 Tax=Planctomicrobium piriforme TaxID=1576369 RepID=A0A1I3PY80_9PLAN|nr:type II toxin-antitoxin system VapB family antitoxin [Planctomicrobium piriforme]SFJ25896.1 antitoxin of type II TA system, VapB [Planctomicrobium piriforme]